MKVQAVGLGIAAVGLIPGAEVFFPIGGAVMGAGGLAGASGAGMQAVGGLLQLGSDRATGLHNLGYGGLNVVTSISLARLSARAMSTGASVSQRLFNSELKAGSTVAGFISDGITFVSPVTAGYDPRGNITSRTGNVSSAATHTITWYSYNLPNTINASGSQSSQFFYAPDRARWKQVASYGGTGEQTIYIGGLVEKVTLGTVTAWKHYIAGTSGSVAVYTRKSSGTNELHYLTRDHLGSIDSVTNAAGAAEVRLSFSAVGQRRNEATWSGNPTSGDWVGITNTTRRGFTSQEMLDNLNLTHMNGRVYDQLIGQFTSADPFVDGAGNTQGWNRYAYVHGNPLKSWDPSGYTEVIVAWINGDKVPIEGVVVTASRGSGNSSNFAAALHGSVVRSIGGEFSGGGGGGGALNVIEEVVTTASRIRPKGPLMSAVPGTSSTEPSQREIPCNTLGWQGDAGVTDNLANGATAADAAVRATAGAASNAAHLSGYYRGALGRIDVVTDAAETLGDAARGDTGRAVAGTIDTAMDFGGKTPVSFGAGVAWDEAGGARGALDTYRHVRPLIEAGPMPALFEAQRALRCQRPN